jgi:phosphatidylglycerophosphate synthase/uncharacterized membrane protein YbhN (UPF0104 family)
LVASILYADSRQVLKLLEGVDARWLALAFIVSLLQLVVLGARYAHVARTLGLELSWLRGTTEYSLSVLVNQVLPTGVLGDGLRAVRHAKHDREHGLFETLQAVALDRIAGHLALWLVVFVTAPFAPPVAGFAWPRLLLGGLLVAVVLCVLCVTLAKIRRLGRLSNWIASLSKNTVKLLHPRYAVVHLPLSLALIGLLLAQLYIAARAVGITLGAAELLWLGPLVLLATSAPSFFAGWGVREGASALLFAAIGLSGSMGVAVALVFGAFTLVVSLPAVVVLLFDSERAAPLQTRWSQGHALSALAGIGLALWSRFPPLLGVVTLLSLATLLVQSRSEWTPSGRFGFANWVTSGRLALTFLLLFGSESWSGGVLAGIAITVLLLDVADGWLARRTHSASEFGAHFDVEVDTLLVVSLALALMTREQAGAWVLLPPVLRYLYVLAPLMFTPLREAPARTQLGRYSYIFMMAGFVAALLLPPAWAYGLALAGAASVCFSCLASFWHRYGPATGSP